MCKNKAHKKGIWVLYEWKRVWIVCLKRGTHWQAAPSAPSEPAGRTEPAALSARPSGISAAAWLSS